VETSGEVGLWGRPLPGPKSDSEVKTEESEGIPASYGHGSALDVELRMEKSS
jgi:hypothetical protein